MENSLRIFGLCLVQGAADAEDYKENEGSGIYIPIQLPANPYLA